MLIRKAVHRVLFPASVVLPVWLLVGWGVFGQGAWSFLGLLILCPLLFIALAVVSGLVYARPSVRQSRAVAWRDVALFGGWYAAIVGFGFFGPASPWFAVAGVLIGLATFWWSVASLVTDAAKRMRDAMGDFSVPSSAGPAPQLPPVDGGEYIVVRETRKKSA